MAKEICISSTPHETRLAILEDDQLAEIYYERENEYTLAGSIYNGRVTRVLPGMQSAFVDIGLERDAFLYVTDFMELEDPEETDELEKAAVSGQNQPLREVRQKAEPKQEQKQEPRPDKTHKEPKERRLVVEAAPDAVAVKPASAQGAESDEEDSNTPGAKRWRGRRRRRGGRNAASTDENQVEVTEKEEVKSEVHDEIAESNTEIAPEIQASAGASSDCASLEALPRANRALDRSPAPFLLPGESLSKYGGTSTLDAVQPASSSTPTESVRPSSTFKPSTLIESPLAWDGSGLLPGESLSKHRNREPEVGIPVADIEDVKTPESAILETYEASYEPASALEETVEEVLLPVADEAQTFEQVQVEEAVIAIPEHVVAEAVPSTETFSEAVAVEHILSDASDATVPEADATASHNVDPLPPTGFRLFGLGGKKKQEEVAVVEEAKPASVPSVSAYAPESDLFEDELIEEEAFAAPRSTRTKASKRDLDTTEEEALPTHIHSGDLGEMLQEAHLDHRIQLNFDDKEEEGDEAFDGEEDDDAEEVSAEGQSASSEAQTQQHRERNGKNRRGRGAQAAPPAAQGGRRGPSRRASQMSNLPVISDLLKPGQEILVQIAKEPIAKKGARITSHIALPGRFLVFMPTVTHIGVSRKIESDAERQRLKRILINERGEASGGFIVRTAAEGASEDELRSDLRFLLNMWAQIKQRSESSKSPALIYRDLSLIERILRDQVSTNFSSIWVDSEEDYERIVRFLNGFSPSLVRRVKLYTKETPLFEHFGIQDEISKALRSKVWLKSGGSIVINQTEALVAIDINTGKYVGKSSRLEDTIVKTNLDAVPEIVRQIRLRDLGGIIVIDFIDMDDRKNRYKVMAALEEALKSDRVPTKVLQFNDFGLVAITRKRVKQSLERTLSIPCPTCQATGMVKSPATVCNEIYIELRKMRKHFDGADVLLRVNPETVKVLKANNGSWLTEFEELIHKNILIKSDPTLHPEQFDIQG